MRRIVALLGFMVLAVLPSGGFTRAEGFPVLRGPYLGQTPPGATPEVFAPGVVSGEGGEGCYGFMDGGRLFVFKHSPRDSDWKWVPLSLMALEDGRWTEPSTTTLEELYPYNCARSGRPEPAAPEGEHLAGEARSGWLGDAENAPVPHQHRRPRCLSDRYTRRHALLHERSRRRIRQERCLSLQTAGRQVHRAGASRGACEHRVLRSRRVCRPRRELPHLLLGQAGRVRQIRSLRHVPEGR